MFPDVSVGFPTSIVRQRPQPCQKGFAQDACGYKLPAASPAAQNEASFSKA